MCSRATRLPSAPWETTIRAWDRLWPTPGSGVLGTWPGPRASVALLTPSKTGESRPTRGAMTLPTRSPSSSGAKTTGEEERGRRVSSVYMACPTAAAARIPQARRMAVIARPSLHDRMVFMLSSPGGYRPALGGPDSRFRALASLPRKKHSREGQGQPRDGETRGGGTGSGQSGACLGRGGLWRGGLRRRGRRVSRRRRRGSRRGGRAAVRARGRRLGGGGLRRGRDADLLAIDHLSADVGRLDGDLVRSRRHVLKRCNIGFAGGQRLLELTIEKDVEFGGRKRAFPEFGSLTLSENRASVVHRHADRGAGDRRSLGRLRDSKVQIVLRRPRRVPVGVLREAEARDGEESENEKNKS